VYFPPQSRWSTLVVTDTTAAPPLVAATTLDTITNNAKTESVHQIIEVQHVTKPETTLDITKPDTTLDITKSETTLNSNNVVTGEVMGRPRPKFCKNILKKPKRILMIFPRNMLPMTSNICLVGILCVVVVVGAVVATSNNQEGGETPGSSICVLGVHPAAAL
jgi:hypothetical protein